EVVQGREDQREAERVIDAVPPRGRGVVALPAQMVGKRLWRQLEALVVTEVREVRQEPERHTLPHAPGHRQPAETLVATDDPGRPLLVEPFPEREPVHV